MVVQQASVREEEHLSSGRAPVLTREDFEVRDEFEPGEAFVVVHSAFGQPGGALTTGHIRWMLATLDVLERTSPEVFWEWARQRAPSGSIIEVDHVAGNLAVAHG